MPVLNYHKDEKDMPDMSKEQKCDTCCCVQIGNKMYYSYPSKNKIEVICRSCFVSQTRRPTKRAIDGATVSPIERDWSGEEEDKAWAHLQKTAPQLTQDRCTASC